MQGHSDSQCQCMVITSKRSCISPQNVCFGTEILLHSPVHAHAVEREEEEREKGKWMIEQNFMRDHAVVYE